MNVFDLTCGIVTYENDFEILSHTISSVLNTELNIQLVIFDNSGTDKIKKLCYDKRIVYHYHPKNIGFGAGHNYIWQHLRGNAPFHLVLNPDVYFDRDTLIYLSNYLRLYPEVGLAMPKILNVDGSLQYNCKLLPTPWNLFVRRFLYSFQRIVARSDYYYEMRFADYNCEMDVPYLSGCFMFLNANAVEEVGLFDERFFLYGEDIDFSRRMHLAYKTRYYPKVQVYHHHAKGSYKSLRLFWHNLRSAILYFNKWGWWDKERVLVNREVFNMVKYKLC